MQPHPNNQSSRENIEDEPSRKFNGAVFFKCFSYPTNLSSKLMHVFEVIFLYFRENGAQLYFPPLPVE